METFSLLARVVVLNALLISSLLLVGCANIIGRVIAPQLSEKEISGIVASVGEEPTRYDHLTYLTVDLFRSSGKPEPASSLKIAQISRKLKNTLLAECKFLPANVKTIDDASKEFVSQSQDFLRGSVNPVNFNIGGLIFMNVPPNIQGAMLEAEKSRKINIQTLCRVANDIVLVSDDNSPLTISSDGVIRISASFIQTVAVQNSTRSSISIRDILTAIRRDKVSDEMKPKIASFSYGFDAALRFAIRHETAHLELSHHEVFSRAPRCQTLRKIELAADEHAAYSIGISNKNERLVIDGYASWNPAERAEWKPLLENFKRNDQIAIAAITDVINMDGQSEFFIDTKRCSYPQPALRISVITPALKAQL